MIQRLESSTSENTRLSDFSRSVVVKFHEKFINDGETRSSRENIALPYIIKENEHRRQSRIIKQNRHPKVASADSAM